MQNKHGLSREIPPAVKLLVRQRCGFGCVICGSGLIEYEHVNPIFADAEEHSADKITLLCPTCHANVTRKFWSKEKVEKANEKPFCKQAGNPKSMLDFSGDHPILVFGGTTFYNCSIPIKLFHIPLIKIAPPEVEGGPFLLSAMFCDSQGRISLEIENNEWTAQSTNWDVTVIGGKITIKENKGQTHLVLKVDPPNKITVETLNMKFGKFTFFVTPLLYEITGPSGSKIRMSGGMTDGCEVGMVIGNF